MDPTTLRDQIAAHRQALADQIAAATAQIHDCDVQLALLATLLAPGEPAPEQAPPGAAQPA